MSKGKLYLVPVTLGGDQIEDIVPSLVIKKAISLRYFAVENIKIARRYLRKIDRNFPIDDCIFFILNKKTEKAEIYPMIDVILEGNDLGVMSDAGCPGIADPGAELVAIAHDKGILVKPLVGPSSILLALMGSGFSGQEFTFHGYLPKDRKDRIKSLKNFEHDTRRRGISNIFMDTPFRNMNVLDDLLNELADHTMLCVASDITMRSENIQTLSIKEWRKRAYDLNKRPTIFIIGKPQ